MQIKLIFARKVVHPASFWKWGFLEFGSGLFEWTFSNLSVRGSTCVFRSGTGRDSPAWSCDYLYRFISEQEPIMARDRSRWFPLLSVCGNLIGSKPVPNCPFTVWAEAFSQRELKFFLSDSYCFRTSKFLVTFPLGILGLLQSRLTQQDARGLWRKLAAVLEEEICWKNVCFFSKCRLRCELLRVSPIFSKCRLRNDSRLQRNVVRVVLSEIVDKDRNRAIARWRHFTTTTRILEFVVFLCKLRLLFFNPQRDWQI